MSRVHNANTLFGNKTVTEKGAEAYKSTLNACLDLFYAGGASRKTPGELSDLFAKASKENPKVAAAILMWIRDQRHKGAGERQSFRTLCEVAAKEKNLIGDFLFKVIDFIPTIGRYDDLKVFERTPYQSYAAKVWVKGMAEGDFLAFKWAKRNSKMLQKELKLNEAGLRKYIVEGRSKPTLFETLISEGRFSEIDYSKVPSVCFARNSKLFGEKDAKRFQKFLNSKTSKPNTGAIFPHDVYRTVRYGGQVQAGTKQWEALKETFTTDKNILVMCDVSGSMSCTASGSIQCIDISVSLGAFLAETNTGHFKNKIMTFSEKPSLVELSSRGSLKEKFNFIERIDWGMTTNFEAAYAQILSSAVSNRVPQSDLPEFLLVLSDMQFDRCSRGGTHFDNMRNQFERHGYKLPKIVFWNLRHAGNTPATSHDGDVAMVSGFSPGVLQAVIKGEATDPYTVMNIAISPFMQMLNE